MCAIFLFIYQTWDGIDGKQARKTKNCSCLGMIFDHGLDWISISVMGIIHQYLLK